MRKRRIIIAIVAGFAVSLVCAPMGNLVFDVVAEFVGSILSRRPRGVWAHLVPMSLTMALLALPGLIAAVAIVAMRRNDDAETRCRKCGYILRGLTEPRCSECGEAI